MILFESILAKVWLDKQLALVIDGINTLLLSLATDSVSTDQAQIHTIGSEPIDFVARGNKPTKPINLEAILLMKWNRIKNFAQKKATVKRK